jgi:hypothetical protein
MVIIQSGFAPSTPLTHSRIGMNTITRDGTITASSAAAGFPASGAQNPMTYEYWRPTSMPATWAVDAGSAVSCNYFGIAAHTFGSSSTTVSIQYSTDNSSWTTIDSNSPTTDGPLMFLFTPVTARYWRISLSGALIPSVGVVYIGTTLDMQRACYAGLSPINFSRDTVIRPNRSENGLWLGRSIIREGSSMNVSYRHLDYDWYKTYFDPFVEQARKYPFFFAWRPQGYPESVGYVWTNADIAPTTMGIRDLLQVSFDMQGLSIE